MIENQKIQFNSSEPITVTYHDPCHLGRHMEIYEPPRNILKAIPEVSLIEMKRNRNNAWCCGAGGGLKSQFPEMAVDIAKDRISEAIETQSSHVVTSCPFCERNLTDAISQDAEIKVINIIVFIYSRI
jgi:heterodisulfide reductase subunit D